eukprot:4671600-Pyramimonas_sp.AAC.1
MLLISSPSPILSKTPSITAITSITLPDITITTISIHSRFGSMWLVRFAIIHSACGLHVVTPARRMPTGRVSVEESVARAEASHVRTKPCGQNGDQSSDNHPLISSIVQSFLEGKMSAAAVQDVALSAMLHSEGVSELAGLASLGGV